MKKKAEKYEASLKNAKQLLQTADHLTYTTYNIVKDNKILLKILEDVHKSVKLTINSILQYEYLHKNIEIYKKPKENFKSFKNLSEKYNIGQNQLETVIKILEIGKKHEESPFEFGKNDKMVIMTGDKTDTLTIEKMKKYLLEAKDLVRKAEIAFNR